MADENYLAKREELYSRVRSVLSTDGSHVRMEYKLPYFRDMASPDKGVGGAFQPLRGIRVSLANPGLYPS